MEETRHYFTISQANAVVRAIRPMIAEALAIRAELMERQPEIWPVLSNAAGNGGNKAASLVASEFQRLDHLVREVRATGAILRDLNTGLVDFLAILEGEEVFLCWQYGEGEIAFWHGLEDGFTGRQTLP